MNKIIELFKATKGHMNDRDQRSALGYGDSFARGGRLAEQITDAKFKDGVPENRDGLAAAIVSVVAELDRDESYRVRHEARDWLDAPFSQDPAILAWRASRGGPLTTGKD